MRGKNGNSCVQNVLRLNQGLNQDMGRVMFTACHFIYHIYTHICKECMINNLRFEYNMLFFILYCVA